MQMINAATKMKALVVARLLRGEFDSWNNFDENRSIASQIFNNQIARNVSAQIGRNYGDLRKETKKFIEENFDNCGFNDLARLCDSISSGHGLYQRLDQFEKSFFRLDERIKHQFPFYSHVSISLRGLQFEFPELHFLNDLQVSVPHLFENRSRASQILKGKIGDNREELRYVASQEKFLSRSIISASFSLLEAFLSGIFYTALKMEKVGQLDVNEDFLNYARTKESEPLQKRLDRVVRWASNNQFTGMDDPYQDIIGVGKVYRDAIHHTTPFERKNLPAGKRLEALYRIDGDLALAIGHSITEAIIALSDLIYEASQDIEIVRMTMKVREQYPTFEPG